jgi:Ca2+-binding RTX toxin-like protein
MVPRVEALEERALPFCSIIQLGTTITILGSNLADQVAITDNGTGTVSVLCDQNPTPQVFLGIDTINVRTFGGPDLVTYQLAGSVFGHRTVNVDLGAGKDTFRAFLNQNNPLALTLNQNSILNNSSLDFNIFGRQGNDNLSVDLSNGFTIGNNARLGILLNGGAGNDRLAVNATQGNLNPPSLDLVQGTNLSSQGLFDVRLLGGPGVDRTAFAYQGDLNGTLKLNTDGGQGRDTTVANIDATTPSSGTVQARVRGGAGNDNLTLNVRQPAGVCLTLPCGLMIDALIDGGPGFDVCHGTTNVKKINCEL